MKLQVLNPLNTFIDRNPTSPYLKKSMRAVHREYMTKDQILAKYGHLILKEDLDVLDTLEDFSNWNQFITLIFFLIIPLGACSGSTSGGLKVFRLQIAFTLFKRQIHQLMHPSAIFPQRYNNHKVNDTIVRSIIAFFFAYIGVTVFSAILLSASGMEVLDSISTTLACLSNIGPAIGPKYGPCGDFSILNDFQKLVLLIDMILGRLEVLTMIICFMPSLKF